MSKIGILGDLHLREYLGYADYVSDHRLPEKKEIIDFIVDSYHDCDVIVMLGDQLNARNNPSSVLREFVSFIERYENKEVFILAGNHEKNGDGSSALDFLREIKKPRWHIITDRAEHHTINGTSMTFLPYFYRSELEVDNNERGREMVMKLLKPADLLFAHLGFSGTTVNNFLVDNFNEIILPLEQVAKKYKHIFGGHIHQACDKGVLSVLGSTFNNEIGERKKTIIIYDTDKQEVKRITLPGVSIIKKENILPEDLITIFNLDSNQIVKLVLTDPKLKKLVPRYREILSNFKAHMLIEQYPSERRKIDLSGVIIDLGTEDLLKLYARERKVDENKLLNAFDLIK
jgi:DNA repair exonuclease SbcCD nuclease subunit